MRDRGRLSGRIRAILAALGALVLVAAGASTTSACSALFEEPTIAALGPDAVVVVGTIGEQVDGGRLFHVERAFNGGVTTTPMVIAFKEGPAIGDCSYPVSRARDSSLPRIASPTAECPWTW